MTATIVAGESWELAPARSTLKSLDGHRAAVDEVLVPPEFAALRRTRHGGCPPVTVVGNPPRRFRTREEILADLHRHRPDATVLAAGTAAGDPRLPPLHRPPRQRRHARRRAGELEIWTIDTGEEYFAGLAGEPLMAGDVPVWSAYGPGRPVFTRNTNDFAEVHPVRHDDYVVLGSGLLGWRMVLDSDPGADARVLVYDINPAQLAWSRHVIERADVDPRLDDLEHSFAERHPAQAQRQTLPHERLNADAQAHWYALNRTRLAVLRDRLCIEYAEIDLWSEPVRVLNALRVDRSVFFMYLDLFVVWHLDDAPPWIAEFPGLARSLQREVHARSARATFLPSAGSQTLQLDWSPFLGAGGRAACM
jgi:hypothetical protein